MHVFTLFPFTAHRAKFDVMTIEKWPLIQAFALEGVGGYDIFHT